MSIVEGRTLGVQGGTVAGMTEYAQPLRAIGQALETLKVEEFELERNGEDFFVRGKLPLSQRRLLIGTIWGALPHRGDALERAPGSTIDLYYTAADVERLDKEFRLRRGQSQNAGDAWSLSQILRSIGAYVKQKRAYLTRITRESSCIAVEYETSSGSRMKETLVLRELYDLWVRMYLHRAERANH